MPGSPEEMQEVISMLDEISSKYPFAEKQVAALEDALMMGEEPIEGEYADIPPELQDDEVIA